MIYTLANTARCVRPVDVFVNGNKVDHALYADTERGIVRYAPRPLRAKKPERDRVYTRQLRGAVTVVPAGDKA